MKHLLICTMLLGLSACASVPVTPPPPHVITHDYTWRSVKDREGKVHHIRVLPDTAFPEYWAQADGPKPCNPMPLSVVNCVEWPVRGPSDPAPELYKLPDAPVDDNAARSARDR